MKRIACLPYCAFTLLLFPSLSEAKTIYDFQGIPDGSSPASKLVESTAGVFYGTTVEGGSSNSGTVYQLTPPAASGMPWTESVVYSFTGGEDGSEPENAVVIGSNGILYGTTLFGGTVDGGVVFSLTPPRSTGEPWTETVVHNFGVGSDGINPLGTVAIGSDGNLFGTTNGGGASGVGIVYELAKPSSQGTAWTESILYNFTVGTNGSRPSSTLTIGPDGTLYGVAAVGGEAGLGVVFEVEPPSSANGAWTESVIYSFNPSPDANAPMNAGVTLGTKGVLYGTTQYGGTFSNGAVYQLTPPAEPGAAWTEAVIYSFGATPTDGIHPQAPVVLEGNRTLLGTATGGGSHSNGTVYKLTLPEMTGQDGKETILLNFDGLNGSDPLSAVLPGKVGNRRGLFVTAYTGGNNHNQGTIVEIPEL